MTEDRTNHGEKDGDGRKGLTRRGFLATMGTGAVSVAAASQLAAETGAQANVVQADDVVRVTLRINGRSHRFLVEPRWSLTHVLREELGLTGTKIGCGRGECGACTVLMNDLPRYACMTLAVEAENADIVTVEGLMDGEEIGPVQQAFVEKDAYQCGYCTAGQIMAVEGLLRVKADPSLDEVRRHVSGNLCRCGTYPHIFMAAQRAAELKRGGES
jgi:xanthine dehydrogenase YagT iron-sulfur-binding subunit